MSTAGKVVVSAVVVSLYVFGVVLSTPNPHTGLAVFAIALWPILVAELSRGDESPAVLVSMGLPLWGLSAVLLFRAIGDPMPGLLPEEEIAGHIGFVSSTAFFPGGLLAAFALKRMEAIEVSPRRLDWEVFLLAPWIALYVVLAVTTILGLRG